MISSNAAYQISDCIFPFALQATDPKTMWRCTLAEDQATLNFLSSVRMMNISNHLEDNLSSEMALLNPNNEDVSSTAAKVFKIIPLFLVMTTSIICNTIVLHAVYADIRMQTATNMLIVSQSLVDFGTSVLVMPVALISVVHDGWVLGENFCIANSFFNLFFTQTTVMQLVIIAFDRYLVIVKPGTRAMKLADAIRLAMLAWGLGFFGAFPWLLLSNDVKVKYFPGFYTCGQRYQYPLSGLALFIIVSTILLFGMLPLFLIAYCYYQIYKVTRLTRHSVSPLALSNAQMLAINVYAKSTSTSKFVIGTSLIQVFPACFLMLLDGMGVGNIPHSLKVTFKWIMWCHCIVKPMIYASKSPTNIARKYINKLPLSSSNFRVKLNVATISMFANRMKLYRLSTKRTNGHSLENKGQISKPSTLTAEQRTGRPTMLITAKPAWIITAEAGEFSAF